MFGPVLPNRTPVTEANAKGSKYDYPGPVPPKISTCSFTWSALCELPEVFKDVPEAPTPNGGPL